MKNSPRNPPRYASHQKARVRRPELDSPLWRTLPMEILLRVVECLAYEEPDTTTKASLSLVCHKWLEKSAPMLYRGVALRSSRIREFCQCLRNPEGLLRHFVQHVALFLDSFADCSRLSEVSSLLPQTTKLVVSIVPQTIHLSHSHQAHARLVAVTYATFTHVSQLQISGHRFSSFRDLRYLIGCLPSLIRLGLLEVEWAKCPLQTFRTRKIPRKLTSVSCFLSSAMWPLLCCWAWHGASSNPSPDSFLGLAPEEARVAALICQCTSTGSGQHGFLHLRRSIYPHTWVITMYYNSEYIEIHAVQDPAFFSVSTSARIRWIVFHNDYKLELPKGYDGTKLDDYLSQLLGLEQIVFENADVHDSDYIVRDLVRSKDKTVQMSCVDAEKRVKTVNERNVPITDQFPISPFRYQEEVHTWWN